MISTARSARERESRVDEQKSVSSRSPPPPRHYTESRLTRRDHILYQLCLHAIPQDHLSPLPPPLLLRHSRLFPRRIEHDSRTVQDLDALVKRDFLHDPRVPRRRSDSASSTPLERVDEGRLSNVGEPDDADGEGLTCGEVTSVGFEELNKRSGSEGEGGDWGGGRGSGVGGGCGREVERGDVIALRLGGGLEGKGREVMTKVPEPLFDCWTRDEICKDRDERRRESARSSSPRIRASRRSRAHQSC